MKSWQVGSNLFKRKMKKSSKGRKSKAKAQKYHAMGRYLKRFGRPLNEEEYIKAVKDIQNGRARFLERQSVRVTVWIVKIHDNQPVAFYDKERKTIITFITKHMWDHPEENKGLLLD